jgi:hypothetical protein
MASNTTEKERKEVAKKAEVREKSQPYASEVEDRAAEHSQNQASEAPRDDDDADHDPLERAAP